jgi:hypothetical protein
MAIMLDKGRVERPFRYVREDFFLARAFRNLGDLNAQLSQWLDQVANRRLHGTTGRVVTEHFAEEQPFLKPLPAGPFNAVLRLTQRSAPFPTNPALQNERISEHPESRLHTLIMRLQTLAADRAVMESGAASVSCRDPPHSPIASSSGLGYTACIS